MVEGLRARIAAVSRAVESEPKPRVVCLEWTEPLFQAGHWVPEQVQAARVSAPAATAAKRVA